MRRDISSVLNDLHLLDFNISFVFSRKYAKKITFHTCVRQQEIPSRGVDIDTHPQNHLIMRLDEIVTFKMETHKNRFVQQLTHVFWQEYYLE